MRAQPWFGQERTVYSNWDGDVPRFIFFCQAVLEAASALREQLDWFPDVFHVNDWHTGMIPFLIHKRYADDNHVKVEVLVQRAAKLQEADAELNEVERLVRMEETATAGSCSDCGAPHSMGATFCWQCGRPLLQQVSSDAILRR